MQEGVKKKLHISIYIHVICTIEFWICMHNLFIFIYIKYLPLFLQLFSQFILVEKKNTENYQPFPPPGSNVGNIKAHRSCRRKISWLVWRWCFLKLQTIEPKEASRNWKKRTKIWCNLKSWSCEVMKKVLWPFFIPDPWRSPFQPFKKVTWTHHPKKVRIAELPGSWGWKRCGSLQFPSPKPALFPHQG